MASLGVPVTGVGFVRRAGRGTTAFIAGLDSDVEAFAVGVCDPVFEPTRGASPSRNVGGSDAPYCIPTSGLSNGGSGFGAAGCTIAL